MTNTTRPTDSDLRMIAFLLARTVRAIRAERFVRGVELIFKAQDLIDRLPRTEEGQRACKLVEAISDVGWRLAQAAGAHPAPVLAWGAGDRTCPACSTFAEPCLGCGA